jgi:hypothetical protein
VSKAEQDIRRKRQVLDYAAQMGNVRKACRYFGIGRASFYRWRQAFTREGGSGLVGKRPVARCHPKTTRPEVVDQVLHLRRTYHLGPMRIVWYLAATTASRSVTRPSTAFSGDTGCDGCRTESDVARCTRIATRNRCRAITSRST